MKIGEIKAQALRLMFAADGAVISPSDTDDMLTTDAGASHYLAAMPGAINRALGDIERRRVLRPRARRLEEPEDEGGILIFDTAPIPDFIAVDHVSYRSSEGYDGNVSYVMDGSLLMLTPPEGASGEGVWTLFYRYSLPRLLSAYGGEEELEGVPDRVAALIPYYIKGDLFSEDEPGAATEARNWYEAGMAALELPDDERRDGRVVRIFDYPGGMV